MKHILITCCATALSLTCLAQKPDKALSKVTYNFIHVQDTNQRDKPYTENMLLVIGKNASVYTSYDKFEQADIRRKKIEEAVKAQAESPNNTLKLDSRGIKKTTAIDYYNFASEAKFYTKERLVNNYLVEETTPKIDWKISKDTMSFSGINCQKAIAYFKGRNWIAWFATDLPFQSGPWKLNGLPGLIVEAYDDKKEVQFLFTGMENITAIVEPEKAKVNTEPKIISSAGLINVINANGSNDLNKYLSGEISLPADAIKTTRTDLDKLKDAAKKDPVGFMNAQMGGKISGITVTGYGTPQAVKTTLPKIELNNPIELPEQK